MPKRVLIVEDTEDIRAALVITLLEEGYHVTAAADGNEAFSELDVAAPDVVLLDIQLPGMSGIEILKKMRQTLDVPILMFTSSGLTAAVKEAIAEGADDYILKDTGMDELVGRIEKHLQKSEQTGPVAAAKGTQAQQPLVVYVGQDDTVLRLVSSTSKRMGIESSRITTAKVALSRMAARTPSVVIMDLKLRDTDGLSLLKAIGSDRQIPEFPIIMVAENGSPEIRRSALHYGAHSFYYKPVNEVEFEGTLRSLIIKRKSRAA